MNKKYVFRLIFLFSFVVLVGIFLIYRSNIFETFVSYCNGNRYLCNKRYICNGYTVNAKRLAATGKSVCTGEKSMTSSSTCPGFYKTLENCQSGKSDSVSAEVCSTNNVGKYYGLCNSSFWTSECSGCY
jgi:hypothetical protein